MIPVGGAGPGGLLGTGDDVVFSARPTAVGAPGLWAWARQRVALLAVLALLSAGVGGVAALSVFGSGSASPPAPAGSGRSSTAGGGTRLPSLPAASAGQPVPPLGVYAGPGAATAVDALDFELGGKVRYALDYLPQTSWTTLTDPGWIEQDWSSSPVQMVIGVPMLPVAGATMAEGALGAYDGEFVLLAQRLVADGLGGSVLMVGWQPDDEGTAWYVGSAAEAAVYVAYWDQIEAAMAAVPGAHFVFEWDAGDSGTSPVSPALMYPGNAAVGMVATDAFDVVPAGVPDGEQWTSVLNATDGPAWMASFAVAHGKPMALAMWGVAPTADGGGGDAPAFVDQLLAWAGRENLSMCVLWDDGSSAITGGAFPAAESALVKAVSGGTSAAATGTAGASRDAAAGGAGS